MSSLKLDTCNSDNQVKMNKMTVSQLNRCKKESAQFMDKRKKIIMTIVCKPTISNLRFVTLTVCQN